MYTYRYETHCHTAEASACARSSGADVARFYHSLGYSGVIITDHFLNGNTAVPREGLAWTERADMFVSGYLHAKEEGDRIGIDVLFGWEYNYGATEFLTYGLSPEWLVSHPEVMEWTPVEYLDRVRSLGALVIQAHPFRMASYIQMIRLMPDRVDGVEVCNTAQQDIYNERAEWYCESFRDEYRLLRFSGSDNHNVYGKPYPLGGIALDHRASGIGDLIASVREGRYECFRHTPSAR